MNKYLIYDVGYGEQGCEQRWSIYRYYLCKGNSEEEAVKDWIRQSPFSEENVYKDLDDVWNTERSWLIIVKLKGGSNCDTVPILEWDNC